MKEIQKPTTSVLPARRQCPRCGIVRSGYGPEGLCGVCLLDGGLAEDELAEEPSVLPASTVKKGSDGSGNDPNPRDPMPDGLGVAASPEKAAGSAATASESQAEVLKALGTTIRFFGDYEVLGEIARGGMGVVFKARQISLNRLVALKLIRGGMLDGAEALKRFRIEAQAAANLHHPNIVGIHEVGEVQGHPFFSMAYVEGVSLARLSRKQPLPPRRAAAITQRIADAIDHAHQHGILHRDLKPSNVLMDSEDQPQVTDFGLAKVLGADSELTLSGIVMGSPSYMPPEQAEGRIQDITVRSDVYSLGAILYELLCGRPPFVAETTLEILQQVRGTEPVSPRLLNPRIPRDLDTLCLKCLEKLPARRYDTAAAVAAELGRFLADEPIAARPVSGAEKIWRWCRRKPMQAGLIASVLVLITTLAVGATVAAFRIAKARDSERLQRRSAQDSLFIADMNLASQAVEFGSLGVAEQLLEAHRHEDPDLRGFVWRHLWQVCKGEQAAVLQGHSNTVTALCFAPDGRTLASSGNDAQMLLWDAVARREILRVTNVAKVGGFDAEGATIYFSDPSGSLYAYDVASRTQRLCVTNSGQLLCYFTNTHTLATTDRHYVLRTWDAASGRRVNAYRGMGGVNISISDRGLVVAPSSDGQLLAWIQQRGNTLRDEGVLVWSPRTNKAIARFPDDRAISALCFTPDRLSLAVGAEDGDVKIWPLDTNQPPVVLKSGSPNVWQIVFSPDGSKLATCSSDEAIRIWDVATSRLSDILRGHLSSVRSVAFSPDGQWLASGGRDGTVRLWKLDRSRPTQFETNVFDCNGLSDRLHFATNGMLVGHHHDTFRFWDLTTMRETASLPAVVHLKGSAWHSKTLLFDRDSMKLVDIAQGRISDKWPRPELMTNLMCWALSPDGHLLVMGSTEGAIEYWQFPEGRQLAFQSAHRTQVRDLLFSQDGTTLFSAGGDGVIKAWDVPRRTFLTNLFEANQIIGQLALSPDSRTLAAGCFDTTIRLFDVHRRTLVATLRGHRQSVFTVAFSPDGRTLASGSTDYTVKLWHVALQRELATFRPPTVAGHSLDEKIGQVAFSPDGCSLVARTWNGSLRVWRAPTFAEINSENKR